MENPRTVILAMMLAGVVAGEAADSAPGRLYVNDKRAPEDTHDLQVIQEALQKVLPEARKATVCIDLGQGSGSGVIISKEGLILSAAHVTGGVGKEFTVIMEDGRKLKAESLGLNSESDCAMARITEPGEYPFVEMDRSDKTRLGDWVFSLGHSGGFDVKRGSVVRLGRIVRVADSTLQSDCTLIGGDSGGPLFDMEGRLIGIHSRVGMRLPENMHVPMREFIRNWDALQRGDFAGDGPFAKKPEKGKGFLGIGTEDSGDGLKVTKVGSESVAEKAGFKADDVIVSIDDKAIQSKQQFQDFLKEKAPGDKLTCVVRRSGKNETLTVRLGER